MHSIIKILAKVVNREQWHPILTYPLYLMRVAICRCRYACTVRRLRMLDSGAKIRVAFLSMEISKWKCQTIYDLMVKSGRFDPFVVLTMTDEDENHSADDIRNRNLAARRFYEQHGCRVVDGCDPDSRTVIPLNDIGADMVFYQVPWGNLPGQDVYSVSRYALTCYMPYSIENVGSKSKSMRFDFHHMANFHTLLWQTYNWSAAMSTYYYKAQWPWEWAGRQIGTGHTSLDGFTLHGEENKIPGDYVIYAPHFSFTWNGHAPIVNLSTFHWSGKPILEYAKKHPEIKWAFKPHPKLRERLTEIGFMTKDEVDAYYAEWEKLGASCYDGDYQTLFFNSRAMVTDCGSFLCEYMPVGKPLIRLIPDDINVRPAKPCDELFSTFYNCDNLKEMYAAFILVLEEGQDPKRDVRFQASKRACLIGNYAAKNIMDELKRHIG